MNILDKKISELIKDEKIKNMLINDKLIIDDEAKLQKLGSFLTLRSVLTSKNIAFDLYIKKIKALTVDEMAFDVSGNSKFGSDEKSEIQVKGVLPCPIRIQILELVNNFFENNKEYASKISAEFKPASMGVSWMSEKIKNAETEDEIADMYLSAGYDLFFDNKFFGKFKDKGVFKDFTNMDSYNSCFDSSTNPLKDPLSVYSMIGVVPAIFLVNESELGGRKYPKSWKDLLSSEFESSITLPLDDFDLFGALLMGIYSLYGEEALHRLSKNFSKSLHPSQMLKHSKTANKSVVTVMPYFFSKMAKRPMQAVWPEEGAIISPIFMLTKAKKYNELAPFIELFSSKKMADLLANQGYFPSVHKAVDNGISKDKAFVFPSWEFLNSKEAGSKIKELSEIFKGNESK